MRALGVLARLRQLGSVLAPREGTAATLLFVVLVVGVARGAHARPWSSLAIVCERVAAVAAEQCAPAARAHARRVSAGGAALPQPRIPPPVLRALTVCGNGLPAPRAPDRF